MDMIALSLPEFSTLLTVAGALALGGFTLVLAMSCQAYDTPEAGDHD